MPVLLNSLKSSSRSPDCLIDDRVSVGDAYKGRLELRGRKIDSLIEHRMKKPAVELSITPVGCGPIRNRLVREEAGPH